MVLILATCNNAYRSSNGFKMPVAAFPVWFLVSFLCSAGGCTPLPDLGPTPMAGFCHAARDKLVHADQEVEPTIWIEASCVPREADKATP